MLSASRKNNSGNGTKEKRASRGYGAHWQVEEKDEAGMACIPVFKVF